MVELGLGQAGQGFHLAIVSHLQTHRWAPSMVFEDSLPHLLLRNNSNSLHSRCGKSDEICHSKFWWGEGVLKCLARCKGSTGEARGLGTKEGRATERAAAQGSV